MVYPPLLVVRVISPSQSPPPTLTDRPSYPTFKGVRYAAVNFAPVRRPLIPGWIKAHGFADEQMVVLDTIDLAARAIVHRGVHEHHWCKEGKHHGCRGRGGQTFIAGD